MNTVRPPVWPQAATSPVNKGASGSAAQKAFFDQALGRAGGPGASAPAKPAAPAAPVQARPQGANPLAQARAIAQAQAATDDAARKVLRPGSLLNIVV